MHVGGKWLSSPVYFIFNDHLITGNYARKQLWVWREQCSGLDREGGEASRVKVRMEWKWSVGLPGLTEITGNQMGATHPPLNLQDLASDKGLQRFHHTLNYTELTSGLNCSKNMTSWNLAWFKWLMIVFMFYSNFWSTASVQKTALPVFDKSPPAVGSELYLCRRREILFNSAPAFQMAVFDAGVDKNHTWQAKQSNSITGQMKLKPSLDVNIVIKANVMRSYCV